jgi:DNA-directed RNA polymerase specialized sigma24 family protein
VAGEREAAAWLYDGFGRHLYRRLRLRYGYPGGLNPDDLLHDAFVYFFQDRCAALRRILERTPSTELTAEVLERRLWDLACGVASNHRRAARRRGVATPEEDAHLSESPVAERAAVSRELLQKLDKCLRAAPPRVYLYYKLRYWDGLSPREISAATGWPQQVTYKVKEALNAALKACAERLGIGLP